MCHGYGEFVVAEARVEAGKTLEVKLSGRDQFQTSVKYHVTNTRFLGVDFLLSALVTSSQHLQPAHDNDSNSKRPEDYGGPTNYCIFDVGESRFAHGSSCQEVSGLCACLVKET